MIKWLPFLLPRSRTQSLSRSAPLLQPPFILHFAPRNATRRVEDGRDFPERYDVCLVRDMEMDRWKILVEGFDSY